MNYLIFSFISLILPQSAFASRVIYSPNPIAETPVSASTLIDLERKLGGNRWVAGRHCTLKVSKRLLDRKFMKGHYYGEALFLDFETEHMGPRKAQAVVTTDSKWGSKLIADPEFGPTEDVRIELDNTEGTWVQFRHNGSRLVRFEIGNSNGLTLCLAH